MGENYGHAIFEALAAGTAVVLSDRTPWPRDSRGAVEVLSLEKPEAWVGAIERWADFNDRAFADRRVAAVDYVKRYLSSNHATDLTQRLFLLALERSARSE
jgi:glycosyltransferase involved in cell wall biosynthesis